MKSTNTQKTIISLLKLLFASLLIYWLVKTKKITPEPFIQLARTPWLCFAVFALIFIMLIINNYRWILLLRAQSIATSVRETLPLSFIGLFFNIAMPGSVGGDVIKGYYIIEQNPKAKLAAATSVIVDRMVGLYSLAVLAFLAVVTHFGRITASSQLTSLALFITALVFGCTIFFALTFSETLRTHRLTDRVLKNIPLGETIAKVYDAVHEYRRSKKAFVAGVGLSVVAQSLNILSFVVIAKNLGFDNITPGAMFFLVPIGLIAGAVPLSPGGLGVGQAIFLALFGWYGGISPQAGPTLITISQVVQAMLGCVGAVFYFARQKPKLEKLEQVAGSHSHEPHAPVSSL